MNAGAVEMGNTDYSAPQYRSRRGAIKIVHSPFTNLAEAKIQPQSNQMNTAAASDVE